VYEVHLQQEVQLLSKTVEELGHILVLSLDDTPNVYKPERTAT